ncbi:MAG: hypothetical protein IPH31_09800 [Lewinellaceae bacterium]|nr:hypothetical protein [Lewinellaceae bacterium]
MFQQLGGLRWRKVSGCATARLREGYGGQAERYANFEIPEVSIGCTKHESYFQLEVGLNCFTFAIILFVEIQLNRNEFMQTIEIKNGVQVGVDEIIKGIRQLDNQRWQR